MSFAGRAPGRSFAAGFAQGGAADGDDPKNVETRRIRFEDELLEALRKEAAGEQSNVNRERTAAAEAVIAKLTPDECEILARRIEANKQGDALARALNEARTVGPANLKRLLDVVRSKRSGTPPTDTVTARPATAATSERAQAPAPREGAEASAAPAVEPAPAAKAPPVSRASALGTFLYIHSVELKQRLLTRFADLPWPDPAEDVPFTRPGERVFGRALANQIAERLGDLQAVRDLLYPHDLDALLRRTVDLENAQLTPMFAGAFELLIEAAVRDSLTQRVGPRLRTILDMRIPTVEDITPGHPIDPLVSRAITITGVLNYGNVAQTVADTPTSKGPAVTVDWFGKDDEGLWNCGRLSSKDVTREQLAVTLWGDPEKASMAAMIQIYGDIVRVEPSRARTLLPQRFPGARIGITDPTEAEQIKAIAALSRGDAPAKQFAADGTRSKGEPATKAAQGPNAKKRKGRNSTAPQADASKSEPETVDAAKPATIEQIMGVEKEIGRSLGTLRNQLSKVLLGDKLKPAFEHRAERVEQLADADAGTLAYWLPVLQFQHTQLLVIVNQVAPAVSKLVPLLFQPAHLLDDEKRASRALLEKRLGNLADAAAVSHLRDESTRFLAMNTEEDREAGRRRADARQLELETSLDDARAAGSPQNPGNAVPVGAEAAATEQASIRRKGIDGKATENDQKRANVRAGIFALRARITAAHFRIDRVYIDALEVFGDPESFHRLMPPQIKSLPEIVQRVRGHLAEVERVWDQDMAGIDSGMVDDSSDVDALAARLATAQDAFSRIAGDQSIVDFINETTSRIRSARILTSVAQFAATCLITVGVGMAAAHLGNLARVALVGQGASGAVAVTADVLVNVSINSALQVAQSGGEESAGVAVVENLLMEIFTRNLLAPLHKAERMAQKMAGEYARLPHLTSIERQALLELHTSSRTMMGTMVGTMAAQWAARQLRRRFQTLIENDSETEKREAKEAKISDDYALMVLQQGAAIGLGKYFAGKSGEWNTARNRLQLRIADHPQLEPYLLARDAFYQDAKALGESPSPDPAAGDHLMARDTALDLQEQAIFAQKGGNAEITANTARDASGESESAREPTPVADTREPAAPAVVDKGLGARIAAEVQDARYLSGGAFEVEIDGRRVRVTVRRANGATRVLHEGDSVTIEVAKGLDERGFERAVVESLTELRRPKSMTTPGASKDPPKESTETAGDDSVNDGQAGARVPKSATPPTADSSRQKTGASPSTANTPPTDASGASGGSAQPAAGADTTIANGRAATTALPVPAAAPTAPQSGGRVTAPVPGLYEAVDPGFQPTGWQFRDRGPPHPHPDHPGLVQITTDVVAPNGGRGWIERSYDPVTKTVVLENAFLERLPSWIDAGTPMVPGKGTPTVTYLTLRQMKMLGADFGEVKRFKMSTIQNIEAVMQLEHLRRQGMSLDEAIGQTHSVTYATTSIQQSGHDVGAITMDRTGAFKWQLEAMMDHFGMPEPRREELLKKYKLNRYAEVLVNFDIYIELRPHTGGK